MVEALTVRGSMFLSKEIRIVLLTATCAVPSAGVVTVTLGGVVSGVVDAAVVKDALNAAMALPSKSVIPVRVAV